MSNKGTDSMDNWRQFQGTELGGLLKEIYGNNRPKINYPKPKNKSTFQPEMNRFLPVNAKPNSVDPRKTTRINSVKVAVPKCNGIVPNSNNTNLDNYSENRCPIDYLHRRKHEDSIRAEIDEFRMQQLHYRPAYRKATSSEYEKDRLNQIFTKGLAPYELTERKREQDRIDQVRMKRGLSVKQHGGSTKTLNDDEAMSQQIIREIDERTDYLNEMKDLGGISKQEENKIKLEISRRVVELKSLDSKL